VVSLTIDFASPHLFWYTLRTPIFLAACHKAFGCLAEGAYKSSPSTGRLISERPSTGYSFITDLTCNFWIHTLQDQKFLTYADTEFGSRPSWFHNPEALTYRYIIHGEPLRRTVGAKGSHVGTGESDLGR
jgi:hypothetical protein